MPIKRWADKSRQYKLRKQYLREDRKYGRECTISSEEIRKIIARPCFYCVEEVKERGLDRKDHDIGHQARNVVACCLRCNQIRGRNKTVTEVLIKRWRNRYAKEE